MVVAGPWRHPKRDGQPGCKYAEESGARGKHFHMSGSGKLTSNNKCEKRQVRIRGNLGES